MAALSSESACLRRFVEVYWGMRRGLMQDYAKQIAQMFVGWQITLSDMPRLVAKGRGRVEVDLLAQTTHLDGEPTSPFSVSDGVRDWYERAIARDNLGETFVHQITIICDFVIAESREDGDTERQVTFDCKVAIEAENGSWNGASRKSEVWRRSGEQPWIVRDS